MSSTTATADNDPEGVIALLVADAPTLSEATRARLALLVGAQK